MYFSSLIKLVRDPLLKAAISSIFSEWLNLDSLRENDLMGTGLANVSVVIDKVNRELLASSPFALDKFSLGKLRVSVNSDNGNLDVFVKDADIKIFLKEDLVDYQTEIKEKNQPSAGNSAQSSENSLLKKLTQLSLNIEIEGATVEIRPSRRLVNCGFFRAKVGKISLLKKSNQAGENLQASLKLFDVSLAHVAASKTEETSFVALDEKVNVNIDLVPTSRMFKVVVKTAIQSVGVLLTPSTSSTLMLFAAKIAEFTSANEFAKSESIRKNDTTVPQGLQAQVVPSGSDSPRSLAISFGATASTLDSREDELSGGDFEINFELGAAVIAFAGDGDYEERIQLQKPTHSDGEPATIRLGVFESLQLLIENLVLKASDKGVIWAISSVLLREFQVDTSASLNGGVSTQNPQNNSTFNSSLFFHSVMDANESGIHASTIFKISSFYDPQPTTCFKGMQADSILTVSLGDVSLDAEAGLKALTSVSDRVTRACVASLAAGARGSGENADFLEVERIYFKRFFELFGGKSGKQMGPRLLAMIEEAGKNRPIQIKKELPALHLGVKRIVVSLTGATTPFFEAKTLKIQTRPATPQSSVLSLESLSLFEVVTTKNISLRMIEPKPEDQTTFKPSLGHLSLTIPSVRIESNRIRNFIFDVVSTASRLADCASLCSLAAKGMGEEFSTMGLAFEVFPERIEFLQAARSAQSQEAEGNELEMSLSAEVAEISVELGDKSPGIIFVINNALTERAKRLESLSVHIVDDSSAIIPTEAPQVFELFSGKVIGIKASIVQNMFEGLTFDSLNLHMIRNPLVSGIEHCIELDFKDFSLNSSLIRCSSLATLVNSNEKILEILTNYLVDLDNDLAPRLIPFFNLSLLKDEKKPVMDSCSDIFISACSSLKLPRPTLQLDNFELILNDFFVKAKISAQKMRSNSVDHSVDCFKLSKLSQTNFETPLVIVSKLHAFENQVDIESTEFFLAETHIKSLADFGASIQRIGKEIYTKLKQSNVFQKLYDQFNESKDPKPVETPPVKSRKSSFGFNIVSPMSETYKSFDTCMKMNSYTPPSLLFFETALNEFSKTFPEWGFGTSQMKIFVKSISALFKDPDCEAEFGVELGAFFAGVDKEKFALVVEKLNLYEKKMSGNLNIVSNLRKDFFIKLYMSKGNKTNFFLKFDHLSLLLNGNVWNYLDLRLERLISDYIWSESSSGNSNNFDQDELENTKTLVDHAVISEIVIHSMLNEKLNPLLVIKEISNYDTNKHVVKFNDIVDAFSNQIASSLKDFCKNLGVAGSMRAVFFVVWRIVYFLFLRRNFRNVNYTIYKAVKEKIF